MKGPTTVTRGDETPEDELEEGQHPLEGEETNWTGKIFLSTREWKATTVDYDPPHRVSWKSEGAKGTVDGTVTFTPIGDNATLMLMVLEYRCKGPIEWIGQRWQTVGRRCRLDLKHFRRYVMRTEPDELPEPEERRGDPRRSSRRSSRRSPRTRRRRSRRRSSRRGARARARARSRSRARAEEPRQSRSPSEPEPEPSSGRARQACTWLRSAERAPSRRRQEEPEGQDESRTEAESDEDKSMQVKKDESPHRHHRHPRTAHRRLSARTGWAATRTPTCCCRCRTSASTTSGSRSTRSEPHVELHAKVLDLLELHVGAQVSIETVEINIENVRVQAMLKVQLHEVYKIVDRVMTTIDENPEILTNLTGGLGKGLEGALARRHQRREGRAGPRSPERASGGGQGRHHET